MFKWKIASVTKVVDHNVLIFNNNNNEKKHNINKNQVLINYDFRCTT